MRVIIPALLTSLALALPAYAQAPAAPKLSASAAEVQADIKNSREKFKGEPLLLSPLLREGNLRPNIEYRGAANTPVVHETDAEMFYVVEGGATVRTGGKLVNEKRTNTANLEGTAIEGGSDRKVAVGDWFVVPAGQPHQVTAVDGHVVFMAMHVAK